MIRLAGPGALVAGAGNDYEIVPLATLKAFLKETGTADDALLQAVLDFAHRGVYEVTGRFLKVHASTSFDDVLDGSGASVLQLPQFPITAITSVSFGYVSGGGMSPSFVTTQAISANDYFADAATGKLIAGSQGGLPLGVWGIGRNNFRVIYKAGFTSGNMPPDLVDAVCQWAAVKYFRAKDRRLDMVSQAKETESTTYTIQEAPPLVRDVLLHYRRSTYSIGLA